MSIAVSLPVATPARPILRAESQSLGFSVQLQSLRGLAALMVLIGHCLGVLAPSGPVQRLASALCNGQGAVAFFFVLSGLVLALQWSKLQRHRRPIYAYAIRRGFRLYPMLIVAVLLGTLYCNYIHRPGDVPGATTWFDSFYSEPISFNRFLLALTGASAKPAAPLWSILVEIIGSAAVPVLVLCSISWRAKWLIVAVLLTLSFFAWGRTHYNWGLYLIDFYAGVSVLWWGPKWARLFGQMGQMTHALILFSTFTIFIGARSSLSEGHWAAVINLFETICAMLIVSVVYHRVWNPRVLSLRPIVKLGDISYSFYLLHFPIVYFLAGALSGNLANVSRLCWSFELAVAATLLTAVVASVAYRYIEVPAIGVGKWLVR